MLTPSAGSHNRAAFDWRRVTLVSFVLERNNDGLGIHNPTRVHLLLDNLGFGRCANPHFAAESAARWDSASARRRCTA